MRDFSQLKHIDLGEFIDWVWALKAERDKINAENANLRKDAERYRWIRDQSELSSYEDSYALPTVHAWEYKPGPELNEQFGSLDDAIDHAMKTLVQE